MTMPIFDLPDEIKKQLEKHPEWVPFENTSGAMYFVSTCVPTLDEMYIRNEVNKGLDATDQHGSTPLNKKAFKEEARRRHRNQL